ncbi:thiosulfate sulfurtransferase GlpE [Actinobacillus equuli subsp. haemolyticus]|nr:thiosulfate sulfurtransferase GlpE [Actinobacillus equuli subsp. haemolyticus]WGE86875.1 thiosulfate sulfurtransferase GlpE [Actinobacillus equuli subsp. haemolyticus]
MSETFTEISPQQAWELIENEGATLADIRDARRYVYSHPQDAFHLTNESYGRFLDEVDYEEPVIVICYHGVSSRNTAQFLVEQGFECVYSVKGGFDGWERSGLPIETAY